MREHRAKYRLVGRWQVVIAALMVKKTGGAWSVLRPCELLIRRPAGHLTTLILAVFGLTSA